MNKFLKYTAWILVVAGGLNWGLVGLFNFDLVQFIFGHWNWLVRLIYILVAISTLYAAMSTCKCAQNDFV